MARVDGVANVTAADGILPLDGATPEQVATAAAVIAELVRRLNHNLTRRPAEALPEPQDVDAVLWNLHTTSQRLRDLLRHLATRTEALGRHDAIGSTGQYAPDIAAGIAAINLRDAADRLDEAESAIKAAASETSRLYVAKQTGS